MLDSVDVATLVNLIRDSFRVRENHDPIYVDVGRNLTRFSSAQQQVLFGRRGSGKSCLLVHFLRSTSGDKGIHTVYIGMDEIKRLGFPDILIRLLLSVFEGLPGSRVGFFKKIFNRRSSLQNVVKELQDLLDQPETAKVSAKHSAESKSEGEVKAGPDKATAKFTRSDRRGNEITQEFISTKLEHLERHLQDYKRVLREVLTKVNIHAYILVDDYYLIDRSIQPNVVDYLHRLLRGTEAYLKLATIRHRTTLRRHEGQTVGVELSQDIEEISLDKTFEDFESTHEYLHAMLQSMSDQCSSTLRIADLFNPDAPRALTLASGGVPRDFLNIFVEAIEASLRAGKKERLTPTFVNKAGASLSYKSKLANLNEDAGFDSEKLEKLFADVVSFCLGEKKKTAFLVSHEDAQAHPVEQELLQQLMDFKLIHLIDANTSAASGRSGRYAAYTLDFSIFMEPRRRGIELVEFWERDEQRRPVGVRESPDYKLDRANEVITGKQPVREIDDMLSSIAVEKPE